MRKRLKRAGMLPAHLLWHQGRGLVKKTPALVEEKLSDKKCVPCEGGISPFSLEDLFVYQKQVHEDWRVADEGKKIKRDVTFKDFKEAMEFVNKVADVAEAEGHHPDITISYNNVVISLWTHAIGGLSENDFIMAAKIDCISL
ncbi:MAG: 4a-hydroxytetrahydrobiopterin dehydratase [Candidatus Spechtbacterales bacterium]